MAAEESPAVVTTCLMRLQLGALFHALCEAVPDAITQDLS